MNVEAYPLAWPVGRPRTRNRERARFGVKLTGHPFRNKDRLTNYAGLSRLRDELERLGATGVVISTNIPTRQDGLPYSKAREPSDPGVAVYFSLEGRPHCLACDRWDRVADNMAAIAAHIDAIRGQARWGVGDLAQAFAGYRALAAVDAKKPWWEVLGFKERPREHGAVFARHRALAIAHHPDRGGNPNQMAEINAAYSEACKELGC